MLSKGEAARSASAALSPRRESWARTNCDAARRARRIELEAELDGQVSRQVDRKRPAVVHALLHPVHVGLHLGAPHAVVARDAAGTGPVATAASAQVAVADRPVHIGARPGLRAVHVAARDDSLLHGGAGAEGARVGDADGVARRHLLRARLDADGRHVLHRAAHGRRHALDRHRLRHDGRDALVGARLLHDDRRRARDLGGRLHGGERLHVDLLGDDRRRALLHHDRVHDLRGHRHRGGVEDRRGALGDDAGARGGLVLRLVLHALQLDQLLDLLDGREPRRQQERQEQAAVEREGEAAREHAIAPAGAGRGAEPGEGGRRVYARGGRRVERVAHAAGAQRMLAPPPAADLQLARSRHRHRALAPLAKLDPRRPRPVPRARSHARAAPRRTAPAQLRGNSVRTPLKPCNYTILLHFSSDQAMLREPENGVNEIAQRATHVLSGSGDPGYRQASSRWGTSWTQPKSSNC